MRPTPRPRLAAALVIGGLALTGCTAGDRQEAASAASSAGSAAASAAQSAGAAVTSAAPSVGAAASSLASQAQSAAPSVGSAAASMGSGAASAAASMGGQASSAAADHGQHHGGAVPAGMKAATDAKYPVGTKVTVNADHMPGMKGAQGTVTGAYDTTAYQVDYTPTDGGAAVKDHKWVVQEELKDAAGREAKVGDRVVLDADHMPGMKGATATVSGISHRRVYTVDVTMPNGQVMKDHTWFISDELQPAG